VGSVSDNMGRQGRHDNGVHQSARPAAEALRQGEGRLRLRKGSSACENGRGVPALELDEAVRESLRAMLVDDQAATTVLMENRVAELRQQHEERLAGIAAGGSADIVVGINQRRALIEALRARTVPEMPAWMALDRADLLAGARTAGGTWLTAPLLGTSDPRLGRPALRKMGVGRIVVKPDGQDWTFDGFADLGRLVAHGDTGGAVEAPSDRTTQMGHFHRRTGYRRRTKICAGSRTGSKSTYPRGPRHS
jgi:hypothetical protein